MYRLIIDDRERSVHSHLVQLSIPYEIKRINYGDYAIVCNDQIVVIIERKTLDDFGASIKDGRMQNREHLIELRNQTGCQIFFIIEGPRFPAPIRQFTGIPYANIESMIFHMMINYNFHFMYTKDTLGTIQIIERLIKSIDTNKQKNVAIQQVENPIVAGTDILRQKIEVNDNDILRKMWMAIPAIGTNTADFLLQRISIGSIVRNNISTENLNDIMQSAVHMHKKKVLKNITNINIEVQIKILSHIPSISAKSARELLDIQALQNILSCSAETISIIKCCGKTKKPLGLRKASQILKYLTFIYTVDGAKKDPVFNP